MWDTCGKRAETGAMPSASGSDGAGRATTPSKTRSPSRTMDTSLPSTPLSSAGFASKCRVASSPRDEATPPRAAAAAMARVAKETEPQPKSEVRSPQALRSARCAAPFDLDGCLNLSDLHQTFSTLVDVSLAFC